MPTNIAIIIGAGPGLAAGIARAFAPTHALALLSRSITHESLSAFNLPDGTDVEPYQTDGSAQSLKRIFEQIADRWPGGRIDVGVVNIGGHFSPGPFLENDEDALRSNFDNMAIPAYSFAQNFIRRALADLAGDSHPTLMFTGATMSLRGSAKFAHMAMPQFAIRALAQSLAREFHPQGIHVALIIVDGLIDTERVRKMVGRGQEGERLVPDDLAQTYVALYQQPPSAWTHEIDVRPSHESF